MTTKATLLSVAFGLASHIDEGEQPSISTMREWLTAIQTHLAAQQSMADKDLVLYGNCFTFDGIRIDPSNVRIVEPTRAACKESESQQTDTIDDYLPNWAEFWWGEGNWAASLDYKAFLLAERYARAALVAMQSSATCNEVLQDNGSATNYSEIPKGSNDDSFQAQVGAWMDKCFMPSLYSNMTERGDRLLEEVLETLQAHGYDRHRVGTLVDYVFGRPVGEPGQEVGGVMITLAGFCWVAGLDMHAEGQRELERINRPEVMAKIRAKQEAKNALHFDTPLPGAATEYPLCGSDPTSCPENEGHD